jgi:cell division protein FtsB
MNEETLNVDENQEGIEIEDVSNGEDQSIDIGNVLSNIKSKQNKESKLDKTIQSVQEKKDEPNGINKESEPSEKETDKSQTEEKQPEAEEETSEERFSKERKTLEKRVNDSRQRMNDLNRQFKNFEKKIQQYQENGILSEEEAAGLLQETTHDDSTEEMTPLQRYAAVWDKEIENIRKYGNEKDLDSYLEAFLHFAQNGTQQDIEDAFEAFKSLEKDDIALTRKMIEFGKRHHDDIFHKISSAGSLKNLMSNHQEEIQKYQKRIDKLEKEVQKYKEQTEDYIEPSTYDLPHGGNNESSESIENNDNSIGSVLSKVKSQGLRR